MDMVEASPAISWLLSLERDQLFNFLEAILWFVIGIGCLVQVRRKPQHRRWLIILGAAFVVCGVSDLIEIRTRAWYRPFGLLVMKAACVVTFFLGYRAYRKHRR